MVVAGMDSGRLRMDSRVFDIGCGCGRLAQALERYGFRGSYDGIDVDREMIDWCRAHFSADRFRFRFADVYSEVYNPTGSKGPYRVPVDDGSQDLVVGQSLFKHLLEDDLRNYVEEARRVLAPAGHLDMGVFASRTSPNSASWAAVGASITHRQRPCAVSRLPRGSGPRKVATSSSVSRATPGSGGPRSSRVQAQPVALAQVAAGSGLVPRVRFRFRTTGAFSRRSARSLGKSPTITRGTRGLVHRQLCRREPGRKKRQDLQAQQGSSDDLP